MDAEKRERAIHFANTLAKLLDSFFHCALGSITTRGEAYDARSFSINSRYWTDEKHWRKTQSMGISLAKLGSLVVQVAHSPQSKHWATPFVNAPFSELKLTPYLGGLAYDSGAKAEGVIGVSVSNLAEQHDQLLAAIILAKYLDPGLEIRRVTLHGLANRTVFFAASSEQRVVIGDDQQPLTPAPNYIFHLVSNEPSVLLEIFEFHSMRLDGFQRPEPHRNLFIAVSNDRPVHDVPVLGATIYQR